MTLWKKCETQNCLWIFNGQLNSCKSATQTCLKSLSKLGGRVSFDREFVSLSSSTFVGREEQKSCWKSSPVIIATTKSTPVSERGTKIRRSHHSSELYVLRSTTTEPTLLCVIRNARNPEKHWRTQQNIFRSVANEPSRRAITASEKSRDCCVIASATLFYAEDSKSFNYAKKVRDSKCLWTFNVSIKI